MRANGPIQAPHGGSAATGSADTPPSALHDSRPDAINARDDPATIEFVDSDPRS
jgi:hypothetical protein